jgi:hypothetical protein
VQEEDPPLLLKMTRDTEQLPFMSALGAFELRVAYANATYDHLVGWRTSCIRREGELPKLPKKWPDDKYKFIMGVEDCAAVPLSERASEGGFSAGMRTSSGECTVGGNVLVRESGNSERISFSHLVTVRIWANGRTKLVVNGEKQGCVSGPACCFTRGASLSGRGTRLSNAWLSNCARLGEMSEEPRRIKGLN